MKKFYYPLIILCFSVFSLSKTTAQGVGINATGAVPDPSAMLHVEGGFLVTGAPGGAVPDLGAGSRLMFYPVKAAFRAGNVTGTQWNNINVGLYSVALGNNTIATANSSTAMGNNTLAAGANSTAMGINSIANNSSATAMGNTTVASGVNAFAMGIFTTASGANSTAIGNNTIASGNNSTAMGINSIANNSSATAMGNSTTASGGNSTAIGNSTTASGFNSTAIGNNTTASGPNSTAMGNGVSTNSRDGAFVIGDNSLVAAMTSSADNQMSMRFAGGYRLFSNLINTTGVTLAPGGGSWSTVSDKHKKENFSALDAESILKKVAALPLSKWNYKSQPASQKHVGPMAQDFYAAFQLDGIGNDSTINTGDIDGINMAAIQALEKRTADLKNENERLKTSVAELQKKFTAQQKLIEQLLINTKQTHQSSAFTRQHATK